MDNQRLILFVALSLVILLLWQSWQEDYGPQPGATTAPTETAIADMPDMLTKGDVSDDVPGSADELAQVVAVPDTRYRTRRCSRAAVT
jgi:YidC/Oxa1 family membrane protein insertase